MAATLTLPVSRRLFVRGLAAGAAALAGGAALAQETQPLGSTRSVEPPMGRLSVTVAADGDGLPGARIRLFRTEGAVNDLHTDRSGRAVFLDLALGDYLIQVFDEVHGTVETAVRVTSGETAVEVDMTTPTN